ncbi:MAG: putative single-stranded DNA-binding protein [Prokaryotic dsDNA virus sp.]|nr:MAG: putative single-stranded DNA-binding protein [Prokaryotic dsDNA virus sp.]|tara:strand:+ start:30844 stop:31293 length:450 start_codon:yes stop_codon:yes gene_type:complete
MKNKCNFIGRVGQDPQVNQTGNGVKVANVSIAVSEKFKDGQGNQQERTEWVRLIFWGNRNGDGLAGVVERFVKKGDLIDVESKLQTRKWTDQSGQEKYNTEFVVTDLVMLGGNKNGGSNNNSGGSGDGWGKGGSSGRGSPDLDGDPIPF